MGSETTSAIWPGRVLAAIAAAIALATVTVVLAGGLGDPDTTSQVDMVGQRFDPGTIRIRATAPQVQVTNTDLYVHDIALPETGLLVRVAPDGTSTVDFDGVGPGTYTVYCTLHSDLSESDPARAGMAATLVVE